MSFDPKKCQLPEIWCGVGETPAGYSREGSSYECLRKGFGSGMYTERRKSLPPSSLQQIRYVGEKYESRFQQEGIASLTSLREKMRGRSSTQIRSTLERILRRSGGKVDAKAYNSVLLHLHEKGVGSLPSCRKVKG